MFFLVDQEESRPAVSSIEEENSNDTQCLETDTSTQNSQLPSPETPQSTTTSSSFKRSRNVSTWTKKREQFLDASLKVLRQDATLSQTQNNTPESQELTFGRNVGQQLQEVEQKQKIIAQKLISDVLFHAKLGHLNDFSVINIVPQPVTYQYSSYVQPRLEAQQPQQQPYTKLPTAPAQQASSQTTLSRQPEVPQQQTFTDLSYPTHNQAAEDNRHTLEEFIHFHHPPL